MHSCTDTVVHGDSTAIRNAVLETFDSEDTPIRVFEAASISPPVTTQSSNSTLHDVSWDVIPIITGDPTVLKCFRRRGTCCTTSEPLLTWMILHDTCTHHSIQ